jgi:hypothetical protein
MNTSLTPEEIKTYDEIWKEITSEERQGVTVGACSAASAGSASVPVVGLDKILDYLIGEARQKVDELMSEPSGNFDFGYAEGRRAALVELREMLYPKKAAQTPSEKLTR